MMATVPHVTSGLGLRKFQADEFLLTRVYMSVAVFTTACSLHMPVKRPPQRVNNLLFYFDSNDFCTQD